MNILDKNFKYTNSAETDIRRTFARVRKQMREQEEQRKQAEQERAEKVRKIHERT